MMLMILPIMMLLGSDDDAHEMMVTTLVLVTWSLMTMIIMAMGTDMVMMLEMYVRVAPDDTRAHGEAYDRDEKDDVDEDRPAIDKW